MDAACEKWPNLRLRWQALRDRLIHTAAKEGQVLRYEAGLFGIQVPASEGTPELWLICQLKGDTLTVRSVMFDGASP